MLTAELVAEVQQLHEGADRGYHGWSHPKALLALLPEVRDQLHDPVAVECAILFHDAIYEPTRTDIEQRSAALAKKMLLGVVPDDVLRRTARLIEATQRQSGPRRPDRRRGCGLPEILGHGPLSPGGDAVPL